MLVSDPRFRRALLATALTAALALCAEPGGPSSTYAEGGTALRFFGTGPSDLDRVKIPLGPLSGGQITASRPVNVGADFTVEFWMKATAAENSAPACAGTGWYYGNIIIDRDVDSNGDTDPSDDYGDYGVALCSGRIVFGVNAAGDDRLLVGSTAVTDGAWHHIAVTRDDGGMMRIFVDGVEDASRAGPAGRVDYRVNRPTARPASDPYLVFGAEKHDYDGSRYYSGLLDDVRISNAVRYTTDFARPSAPHPADSTTVALYRFDEGSGTSVSDAAGAAGGPSDGTLLPRSGGAAQHWSADTPFSAGPNPSPSASASASPSVSPSTSPSVSPSTSPSPSASPGPSPGTGCTAALALQRAARSPISATPVARRSLGANVQPQVYLPFVGCAKV